METTVSKPAFILKISKPEDERVVNGGKDFRGKVDRILSTNSNCNFLKALYNAGSFFLVLPGTFQVQGVNDIKPRYFFKKGCENFQALVLVSQGLSLTLPMLCEFYTSRTSVWNEWKGPKFGGFFRMFLYFLWVSLIFNLYHTFRTRSSAFAELLDKVRAIEMNFEAHGILNHNLTPNVMRLVLATCILSIPLWALYAQVAIQNHLLTNTPESVLRDKVCGINLKYCAQMNTCVNLTDTQTDVVKMIIKSQSQNHGFCYNILPLPPAYLLLLGLLFLAELMAQIATRFSEIFAVAHSLVFFWIVRNFVAFLKEKKEGTCEKERRLMALEIFDEICKFSDLMDYVIGPVVGFCVLCILTYYANIMHAVSTDGWVVLFQILLYTVIIGSFLIVAAEANSMLGYLVFWLQNTREKNSVRYAGVPLVKASISRFEDYERVSVALIQLERNQVGIRGRVFTVTYGFVGSTVSLLLSYSILFAQLKGN